MNALKTLRQHAAPSYIHGSGTVTRSVSFGAIEFKAMEERRKMREIRMDRSSFIRAALEDILGLRGHPEIRAFNKQPTAATPDVAALTDTSQQSSAPLDTLIDHLIEKRLTEILQRKSAP